jgi:FkbM family methyltransferase
MRGDSTHLVHENFRANRESQIPKGSPPASGPPFESGLRLLEERWKYLKAQEGFRRAPLLTACRLISWRTRCLLKKPAVINLPEWNVRMFLPPEWRGIAKLVFAFREDYEPEMSCLKTILSPGNVFIDAGANVGIYTLAASRIVGEAGRVLAFEPSAQSFPALEKNIALNSLTNVHPFPVALTQENGRAWLHRGPNPTLNSLGKDPSWKADGEEIVTKTLDLALHHAGIDRVDVIKMDVQGAEELVLRGGWNTVTSARPIIIFEVWPEGAALLGLSPNGAWELLESAGYEFFAVRRGGTFSCIKSPPAIGNVVAIHGGMSSKRWSPAERIRCNP